MSEISQKKPQHRTVLLGVDASEHSIRAFNCKYTKLNSKFFSCMVFYEGCPSNKKTCHTARDEHSKQLLLLSPIAGIPKIVTQYLYFKLQFNSGKQLCVASTRKQKLFNMIGTKEEMYKLKFICSSRDRSCNAWSD